MEILLKIISFVLLVSLIIFPILVLKQLQKRKTKNIFIPYLMISLIITFILILIIAWWTNFSNKLLLSHLGYDFEAMNDIQRFQDVASENLDTVKKLRISTMGIGWPLKAFMFYPFYFPYLLIVSFGSSFLTRIKQKSN
ncbi:hypothetical protein [Flavobacterium sp. LAR06]|uniref:hypothetical protein n=1 Tax=Flavobacterium sp. LAR06 TaxID=3064897 RepID=UPI0035C0558E